METTVTVERINEEMEDLSSHEILRENLKRKTRGKRVNAFSEPKCPDCGKICKDRGSLSKHVKIHSVHNPFACPHCSYEAKTKPYLLRHVRRVHGGPPTGHACDFCGKTFHFKSALVNHERVHTGAKPNKCDVCGKEFSAKYSLMTHKLIHTDEKPFQCPFCEYACRDSSTLRKHKHRHLGTQKMHQCHLCPRRYDTKSYLKDHILSVHTQPEVRNFKCDKCPATFKKNHVLKKHIDVVHNRSYECTCPVCGVTLSSYHNLKSHAAAHMDERPYQCGFDACLATFKDRQALKKHSLIHNTAAHVICDLCGKTFSRKTRLVLHLRTHLPRTRREQCQYCGDKFYTMQYLIKHVRQKHARKRQRYKCDMCGFVTYNKPSIVMHIKYGHNANKGKCQICGKIYKRTTHLKLHYWNTHNMRFKSNTRMRTLTEGPLVRVKEEPPEPVADLEVDLLDIDKEEPFAGFDPSEASCGSVSPLGLTRRKEQTLEQFLAGVIHDADNDILDPSNDVEPSTSSQEMSLEESVHSQQISLQDFIRQQNLYSKESTSENFIEDTPVIDKQDEMNEEQYLDLLSNSQIADNVVQKREVVNEDKQLKDTPVGDFIQLRNVSELMDVKKVKGYENEMVLDKESSSKLVEIVIEPNEFVSENVRVSDLADEKLKCEFVDENIRKQEGFVEGMEVEAAFDTVKDYVQHESVEQSGSAGGIQLQDISKNIEDSMLLNESVDQNVQKQTEHEVLQSQEVPVTAEDEILENVNQNAEEHERCVEDSISDNVVEVTQTEYVGTNIETQGKENCSQGIIESVTDTGVEVEQDQNPTIDKEMIDAAESIEGEIYAQKSNSIANVNLEEIIHAQESIEDENCAQKSNPTDDINLGEVSQEKVLNSSRNEDIVQDPEESIVQNQQDCIDGQHVTQTEQLSVDVPQNDIDNAESSEDEPLVRYKSKVKKNKKSKIKKKFKGKVVRNRQSTESGDQRSDADDVLGDGDGEIGDEMSQRTCMPVEEFIQRVIGVAEESQEEAVIVDREAEASVQKKMKDMLVKMKRTASGKLGEYRANAGRLKVFTPDEIEDLKNRKAANDALKKGSEDVKSGADGAPASKVPGSLRVVWNMHQCYICFKLFETKPKLIEHCKSHFDVCNETTLKKCPLCPYVTTKSDIKKHLKVKHKEDVNISFMNIKDRKDNATGSRYYYDTKNENVKELEIIPSIKILNKKASMELDRRKREYKNKLVGKDKLVRKGKEWIVVKEKLDLSNHMVPDLDKNCDDYLAVIKKLGVDAKRKGVKMLYPCNKCEKVCQNLSALTLHSRKHDPNPKPFKPRGWKDKEDKKVIEDPETNSNRTAKPKPIVNNHKCDPKLMDFYEKNIKGGDIEFWQFLKIYNKMNKEKVNSFEDLETTTEFGIHFDVSKVGKSQDGEKTDNDVNEDHDKTADVGDANKDSPITKVSEKKTKVKSSSRKNVLIGNRRYLKTIRLTKIEYNKRLEIKSNMRKQLQERAAQS